MTVADLYLSLVLIGVCAVGGAYIYKLHRDNEERLERIERINGILYHALPEPKDTPLDQLLRQRYEEMARGRT